jgi:hypothetical protein
VHRVESFYLNSCGLACNALGLGSVDVDTDPARCKFSCTFSHSKTKIHR